MTAETLVTEINALLREAQERALPPASKSGHDKIPQPGKDPHLTMLASALELPVFRTVRNQFLLSLMMFLRSNLLYLEGPNTC